MIHISNWDPSMELDNNSTAPDLLGPLIFLNLLYASETFSSDSVRDRTDFDFWELVLNV